MRKLLLLFVIITGHLQAQNIAVASFTKDASDMTARVTAPVTDQNGDKCALIKVRTTQTGFSFEGDMLGISKTKQEVGEIWVYVPAKAKKLTIKHQELGILDNYLYPEAIVESTVYIMELTTAKVVTTIVEEELKSAYLIIKSEPEGADVYIDETYLGVTPFNKKMTAGSYTYRVELNMYKPGAGKIEVLGDKPREEINLSLSPAFGYAKITTIPEDGAAVSIDGVNTGQKTPMTTQKLKSGTHRVTVKIPMYQAITKEFEVNEGQTTNLQLSLIPSFATVTEKTSPDADIYIDTEKVGHGTYTARIIEGLHSLEARKEKYYEQREQLELNVGEQKVVNLNLRAKVGNLDITTSPMDARIKLSGIEKGITPTTLKGLIIGDYELVLEKKGFNTIRKTISINENKTTQLNETLAKVEVTRNVEPAVKTETQQLDKKQYDVPVQNYSHKASNYRKKRNTFYIISGVSAGVGAYFAYSANSNYAEYEDATDNASDLHSTIVAQDMIWKAAAVVSAASFTTAIIFGNKAKKAEQNVKASIIPVKKGIGFNLAYNF